MDVTLLSSGVTYQPNDDQLSGVSLGLAAWDGEVGNGSLPVPDSAAAITVVTGRQAKVKEAGTVLMDGFILDLERDRGPQPAGTARQYSFGTADPNALLDGFRVSRTRPAETDYARVKAFAAADVPAFDTTWVLNTETVTMPAKTYASDGGWTAELIPDVVAFTGKTLFVHDKAYGGRCLHYHNLTSGHGCGLSISDVYGAQSTTVFYPGIPDSWQRTSADLKNDVLGVDQTGRTSLATDSTSITAHDADGLQHQARIEFEANSQGDLDVQTAAFLASQKNDLDTYLATIGPLDADALARIRVGDIITVTSSVLGLTASPQRISHMTLTPWGSSPANSPDGLYWAAALEMGAPIRRRRRIKQKPIVSAVLAPDEPWVCIPNNYIVLTTLGEGSGTTILPIPYGNSHTMLGSDAFTLYAGCTYHVYYTVFHPDGSNDITGGLRPTTGPSTAVAQLNFGGKCPDSTTGGVYSNFEDTAFGPLVSTLDYEVEVVGQFYSSCDSTATSVEANIQYVSGPDPRFPMGPGVPCLNGEPRVGQIIKYTAPVGDGTTTDFTTDWSYIPGSLHLLVNGLDWTPEIVETGATTYSLLYPIPLGANSVVVEYRRAA